MSDTITVSGDNLGDALVSIARLEAENERLRAECGIYRQALLRMTDAPQMGALGELPRYLAKDALRYGVKARFLKASKPKSKEVSDG